MNEHQERLLADLPFGWKENWLPSDLVRENEALKDAYVLYINLFCSHTVPARMGKQRCVCVRVCVSLA